MLPARRAVRASNRPNEGPRGSPAIDRLPRVRRIHERSEQMLGALKFSSYCLYGAFVCAVASTILYALYGFGLFRVRTARLQTSAGNTIAAGVTVQRTAGTPTTAGYIATYMQRSALLFMIGALVCRTLVSHRGPYGNMYEFALAFGTTICLAYYIVSRLYPVKSLGALAMTAAAAIMYYGISRPATEKQVAGLIPALQSKWIAIHVPMAMLAYGFFTIGFAAGAMYLMQERLKSDKLPALDVLDEVGYRAVVVGFPLMFATLVLGGIWASEAWGGFWTWDPKETSALVTWLIYAFYMHARVVRGVKGRGVAVILIIGFAATMFTYFGNYWFMGLHGFVGPGGQGGA
jgi:cytochrome c-type biogenesis protein CcsB